MTSPRLPSLRLRSLCAVLLCLALLCLALLPAWADPVDRPPSTSVNAQAVREIEALVQAFKDALKQHDGAALKALFLTDDGPWLTVTDERLLARLRQKWPDKVPDDPVRRSGSPAEFADFVAKSPTSVEERFAHVQITTDSHIGSVYFDYDFRQNGVEQNSGAETWQLVHTRAGWKIAAMLFSFRQPDTPRP